MATVVKVCSHSNIVAKYARNPRMNLVLGFLAYLVSIILLVWN